MGRYLKLKVLIPIFLVSNHLDCFAEIGVPAHNGPKLSKQFAVRNIIDDENIPVINVTPSRPTVVQFPAEIALCQSVSSFIQIGYADAGGTVVQQTPGSGNSFSSVIVTVSASEDKKLTFDDLKSADGTWMLCKMRREKSDTFCQAYNSNEDYCWVAVGIQIVDPKFTNGIVILEKPNKSDSIVQLSDEIPYARTFLDKNQSKNIKNNMSKKEKDKDFKKKDKEIETKKSLIVKANEEKSKKIAIPLLSDDFYDKKTTKLDLVNPNDFEKIAQK